MTWISSHRCDIDIQTEPPNQARLKTTDCHKTKPAKFLAAAVVLCILFFARPSQSQQAVQDTAGLVLRTVEGDPNGPPIVVSVKEGSAAEDAGLRPGDRIMQVGNVATAGRKLDDIEHSIDQQAGSEISLAVKRSFVDALAIVFLTPGFPPITPPETPDGDIHSLANNNEFLANLEKTQKATLEAQAAASDPQGANSEATDTANSFITSALNADAETMAKWQAQAANPMPNATYADGSPVLPAPPRTKKQKFMSILNGVATVAAAFNSASIAGDWVSSPISTGKVDGMFTQLMTFTAHFRFGADGTYTYIVEQSSGNPWTMTVQGAYSAITLNGGQAQITLMPATMDISQVPQIGLTRLGIEGFPGLATQTFTFTPDSNGATLEAVHDRRVSGTGVHLRRAF